MDPCIIAMEVWAACASEATAQVKVGHYPTTVVTGQTLKNYDAAPAARASSPETTSIADSTAPHTCPSWGGGAKPTMGCSPPNSALSPTVLPRDPRSNSSSLPPRPASGDQLYAFRLAALRAGVMYTRASPQQYLDQWQRGGFRTSYQQWRGLLAREASVMAQAQGNNRLTILVGDSLSLWLPMEQLPRSRFWLNQSISGETTAQILNRLHYFRATRPDQIHVMAGINDLKNGATDAQVVSNTQQILARLKQQHPQAQIVIYSILPTRLGNLPSDRISRVNDYIAYVANQQGASFVDLQTTFADTQGLLHRDLTTDGLHLSRQGYEVWQATLVGMR